jgi:predicted ABC-type ATPase
VVRVRAAYRGVRSPRLGAPTREGARERLVAREETPIQLTIVAGANGAGKSSLTAWAHDEFLLPGAVLIDPDAIARERGLTAITAGRITLSLFGETLVRGSDLVVETTLAGRNAFRYIEAGRAAGYALRLLYIGTENVDINMRRIRARVAAGGHDVLEPDVRRRWHRSLENLPKAMAAVNRVALFDNSDDEVGLLPVAEAESGLVRLLAPLRPWANDALVRYQALM